jgi:hypothetical protein
MPTFLIAEFEVALLLFILSANGFLLGGNGKRGNNL